jgi:hypothetical protein
MDDLIAYSNDMVLIVCFTNTILIKKKTKTKTKKNVIAPNFLEMFNSSQHAACILRRLLHQPTFCIKTIYDFLILTIYDIVHYISPRTQRYLKVE